MTRAVMSAALDARLLGVDDDAADDAAERDPGRGSPTAAFITAFKSMFGVGVLTLPHAFTRSGLVAVCVLYLTIAGICAFTMLMVIHLKHSLERMRREQRSKRDGLFFHSQASDVADSPLVTYGDVAFAICGPWGKILVDVQLVMLELMYNVGFLIVMASTLTALCYGQLGGGETGTVLAWIGSLDYNSWIAALFIPVAGLSLIRWLKDLWCLSLLGLLIYLVGVMGLTAFDGWKEHNARLHGGGNVSLPGPQQQHQPYDVVIGAEWSTLHLFAGTAMCVSRPPAVLFVRLKLTLFSLFTGTA